MALFRFKKQEEKEKPEKTNNTETTSAISNAPSYEESTTVEKEMMGTNTKTTLFKLKNKKENIADFFKIDIYNIFKYDLVLTHQSTSNELYTLHLKDIELDTFNHIDVNKYGNGSYDLIFKSKTNYIGIELKQFIDFCIEKLGSDFMNKKSITEDDQRDATLGVFSRLWYNKIKIENLDFTISLTIYNIMKD